MNEIINNRNTGPLIQSAWLLIAGTLLSSMLQTRGAQPSTAIRQSPLNGLELVVQTDDDDIGRPLTMFAMDAGHHPAASVRWTGRRSDCVPTGTVFHWVLPGTANMAAFTVAYEDKDQDADGVDDGREILQHQSSPEHWDTDGDGIGDAEEIRHGTNPANPASRPAPTFLSVQGRDIVNTNHRTVQLRGVNIGGWLVYEQWMNQFYPGSIEDDNTLQDTLDGRFNPTGTVSLLELFRNAYFNTNDFVTLKHAGYNCIRLPFLYSLLEDDAQPYVYMQDGWDVLDQVLADCRRYNLYCILDLHGAPGGQNPYPHSGQRTDERNRLWTNAVFQQRTMQLWAAIAARYATNPVVAGYDLLNEPFPDTDGGSRTKADCFTNDIVPLHDRIYHAIRSNDTRHIIFMENNFIGDVRDGNIYLMPEPGAMGWSNVVYESHHYEYVVDQTNDFSFSTHKWVADQLVRQYTQFREQRKVPVYIGEFLPANIRNMDYYLRRFNEAGLHWTHWNYKHWGWDHPFHEWSNWGLRYRRDGADNGVKPDVQNDSFAQLMDLLGRYDHTHYATNEHLMATLQQHLLPLQKAGPCAGFYYNSFSAPDCHTLEDINAWPWQKLSVSDSGWTSYAITNQRGRLRVNWGTNVQMRLEARPEHDAHLNVSDSTGSWFRVDIHSMGPDAGMQLAVMRDETEVSVWESASPGLITRCIHGGGTILLQLYENTNGTAGFGDLLFDSGWHSFCTNAMLALHVTHTNAALHYNGSNCWNGAHHLDTTNWAQGGVCVLEADNLSGGTTPQTWLEVDNIMAWRPGHDTPSWFEDDFTAYADWTELVNQPDHWSIRDMEGEDGNQQSLVYDQRLTVIPARTFYGGTWLHPFHDYANPFRCAITGNQVLALSADLYNFVDGVLKLCIVPEYVPREIYWRYDGPALYAEIKYQPNGLLVFDVFRLDGVDNATWCGGAWDIAYVENRTVSFQVSNERGAVYYGTNELVNVEHSMTNFHSAFAHGLFPHLEYRNESSTTNASFDLLAVQARRLPYFLP
jgi:aryl-phospho-beta-D-glucosidase BglC (GH1 family)